MYDTLEQILARHCGPVLMGRKPAALVALPHALRGEITAIGALAAGLCATPISRRPRNDLFLIYRPALLSAALEDPCARCLLARHGYPVEKGLSHMVLHLKRRVARSEEFPHEVGLFLGYPPEDVAGFIDNKGINYKLCGLWKVYGDESRARALFAEYRECKNYLTDYVEAGGHLYDLQLDMA